MPPIQPPRGVTLLKQLKQLHSTLRNPMYYGSPAVAESVTTPKVKKIPRDERKALVESYVNEYRAANGGKFPTLRKTYKDVGGSYYIVRNIFQELKFKQNAPLPIVAKALSEVPASVPNDASSHTVNDVPHDPQSHSAVGKAKDFSVGVVDPVFQAETMEKESDQIWATIDCAHPDSDEITLEGNNLVVTATHDKGESSKNSETEEEENLTHLGSLESKADHLEGAAVLESVVPTEESTIIKDSDEITLEGGNLLIGAAQEIRETETAPNDNIDCKWDSLTDLLGSEKNLTLEEVSKDSDVEEEINLKNVLSQELEADHFAGAAVSVKVVPTEEAKTTTYSDESNLEGDNLVIIEESKLDLLEEAAVSANVVLTEETNITNQESKVDHIEEAAVSANVVPTEETKITSQVSEKGVVEVETGERSSAWSNVISFAKGFANFWRKK